MQEIVMWQDLMTGSELALTRLEAGAVETLNLVKEATYQRSLSISFSVCLCLSLPPTANGSNYSTNWLLPATTPTPRYLSLLNLSLLSSPVLLSVFFFSFFWLRNWRDSRRVVSNPLDSHHFCVQ